MIAHQTLEIGRLWWYRCVYCNGSGMRISLDKKWKKVAVTVGTILICISYRCEIRKFYMQTQCLFLELFCMALLVRGIVLRGSIWWPEETGNVVSNRHGIMLLLLLWLPSRPSFGSPKGLQEISVWYKKVYFKQSELQDDHELRFQIIDPLQPLWGQKGWDGLAPSPLSVKIGI